MALQSLLAWLPKGSATAVFARASSAALIFLATVVWARALGPEEFGAYALAFASFSLVSALCLLGLDQLTAKELAVMLHRKDWPRVWGFVRWVVKVAAFMSLLGALLAAGILFLNPMGWPAESRGAALWIMVGVPAVVLLRVARGAFQAAEQTAKGLWWELTFWNGLLVVVGAGVWLSRAEVSGTTAAIAHAATAAVAATFAVVSLLRIGWPRASPTTEHHNEWIKAGTGFALFASVGLLMQQADVLLLGAISSQEEVGMYSIASRSATLMLIFLGPINQVMGPRLAKAWSSDDRNRAAAIARRAAQLGIVAGAFLLAFFLFLGRPFLGLFGEEYTDAAPTLRILALAQLAFLILGPGSMTLAMTGKVRVAALVHAGALVVGLPVGYVLYSIYGIEGMAWGRMAILSIGGVLTGAIAYHHVGRRIDPWMK